MYRTAHSSSHYQGLGEKLCINGWRRLTTRERQLILANIPAVAPYARVWQIKSICRIFRLNYPETTHITTGKEKLEEKIRQYKKTS